MFFFVGVRGGGDTVGYTDTKKTVLGSAQYTCKFLCKKTQNRIYSANRPNYPVNWGGGGGQTVEWVPQVTWTNSVYVMANRGGNRQHSGRLGRKQKTKQQIREGAQGRKQNAQQQSSKVNTELRLERRAADEAREEVWSENQEGIWD